MYFEIYPQQQNVLTGGLLSRPSLLSGLSGGQWRWRLRAGNHEIMASGEAYATQDGCERAINTMKRQIADAEIRYR